jgi:predicted nucleic acid-binding protein
MVVIDTTIAMLLFRRDVPKRVTDSKGNVIDHADARVAHLVKTLDSLKSKIVIPTPVPSELLVRVTAQERQLILEQINKHAVFRVEPFETKAAVEVAIMTHGASSAGDKKGGLNASWQKVKFDRQIVAIAKVAQSSVIYTDDSDIESIAKAVNIPTLGLADLELPPETAQGQLPLEKAHDISDEIAAQTKAHKEPEPPEDQPEIVGE